MIEVISIIYPLLLHLSPDTLSRASTGLATSENLKLLFSFISGGAVGAVITIIYNRYRGKIQTMKCYYIDDGVISTLPTTTNQGVTHQNVYSKQFLLKNTTNLDHKQFEVIFEFDITAMITRYTVISKIGVDKYNNTLLKSNELSVTIRDFNRDDEAEFIFEIANLTKNLINIIEANCTGFKIKVKDKRKKAKRSKLTLVEKAKLHRR